MSSDTDMQVFVKRIARLEVRNAWLEQLEARIKELEQEVETLKADKRLFADKLHGQTR